MLLISSSQMRSFDLDCYERYISRFLVIMEGFYFKYDLLAALRRFPTAMKPRDLAVNLVKRANDCGFVAEGDVTPFCLMLICDHPEFRSHSSLEWIKSIVMNTNIDPASRMDAVFALLQPTPRDLIFQK